MTTKAEQTVAKYRAKYNPHHTIEATEMYNDLQFLLTTIEIQDRVLRDIRTLTDAVTTDITL